MLDQIEGDVRSVALGINDQGEIVGFSRTGGAVLRAVFWENANATIQNLNDLTFPGSPYLLIAGDLNNRGQIAGYTGDGLGFRATLRHSHNQVEPSGEHNGTNTGGVLPDNVRQVLQRWGLDN